MKSLKYIIFLLGVFCISNLSAQRIDALPASKIQNKKANDKVYVMTVKEQGLYTVKVLNPMGEIQTSPIKKKKYHASERVEFRINTKFWKPGTYIIIAENELGHTFTKKFVLPRKKVNTKE